MIASNRCCTLVGRTSTMQIACSNTSQRCSAGLSSADAIWVQWTRYIHETSSGWFRLCDTVDTPYKCGHKGIDRIVCGIKKKHSLNFRRLFWPCLCVCKYTKLLPYCWLLYKSSGTGVPNELASEYNMCITYKPRKNTWPTLSTLTPSWEKL